MNEDYLWDKSGEPDPQIQQLEEILGTLRYQPKPFEIPSNVPAPRRRNYFPLLAIAATLLVALLAGGIWLRVRTTNEAAPQRAAVAPVPTVQEKAAPEINKPADKKFVAVNISKRRHKSLSTALAKREREEALAAKEQLMFALRLASEKLNQAYKKTQSRSPTNQIKNNHRVG